MTLLEIQNCSSANLAQTYFSLGLALPNSSMVVEEGFQACLGEFEHPICNFATKLNLDPWSAKRLVTLATSKRAFSVYALPGDGPPELGEILTRGGFEVSYRLAQLVAEPCLGMDLPAMEMAEDSAQRTEVARFMTDQFFGRQTEAFRRRIAHATAEAKGLQLYELFERRVRIGAVMLCQSEGVVGLYNLCVTPGQRSKGIGTSITKWALSLGNDCQKLVTLQCDPRLQSWYESHGFCCTGTVEVYTLSKAGRSDIMNVT